MKNKIVTFVLLFITYTAFAQTPDTSYWTTGGIVAIRGSQASFTNWAQGGENNLSGTGSVQLFAKYQKEKLSFENVLLADLGYLLQGKDTNRTVKKVDDRFEFNSKFGYSAAEKWNYSALFNFKTQFFKGFNYPKLNESYLSNFMAPAYIKLALGMDYKPVPYFSLFLSPATLRWTIVSDDSLAAAGAFGLNRADSTLTGSNVKSHSRTEAGAFVRAVFRKDIATNVNLFTKLELFSDYLKNPQNVDVDWEVIFTMKVNKFLDMQIKTNLIYDDDILIADEKGNKCPRLQFKEVVGVGFVYKFSNRD